MNENAYELFSNFSVETWEKLTHITPMTTYLKINEEGFTLDLVYLANKFANTFVILDDRVTDNEWDTGADFFWRIICDNSEHNLAIQAKKANRDNSRYSGINKYISSVGKTQNELLIDYADKIDYSPYYFFYNGKYNSTILNPSDYGHTDEVYNHRLNSGSVELQRLGCTVLKAEEVNNAAAKHFDGVSRYHETRSLQQFLKELCSCTFGENSEQEIYSQLKDKLPDSFTDINDFSEEDEMAEYVNGYKILRSKNLDLNDSRIEEAIYHFNLVKENINETNSMKNNKEKKFKIPQAIIFTIS